MTDQKKNKLVLITRTELYFVVAFFTLVLCVLTYTFFFPNKLETIPLEFNLRSGDPLDKILDSLYIKKVIPSKFNMKVAVWVKGAEKKIKAGHYEIDKEYSYLELVDLISGDAIFAQKLITIPEGIDQPSLASLLKKELEIDSVKFMSLSSDRHFIWSLKVSVNNLEGYLLPNTYYFLKSGGAQGVIIKLHGEMQKLFRGKNKEQMEKLGMTQREILTLASIIDGESNDFSEFSRIAGVYHNRLKKNMALQADPTIQFLIRDRKNKTIYQKDLEINSKYNTYRYPGLPPGPINNPGKEAILAALYPEEHNYLYFVANGNGSHMFAITLEEHQQNVRKYRAWLRNQK